MKLKDQIKILVFDYDGTLVDYDRNMSDQTKEALVKLRQNGYKLAISSGRSCAICKTVIEEMTKVEDFDYVFGGNGAEYMDTKTQKIEKYIYIDIPELKQMVKRLDGTLGVPIIYNDRNMHVPYGTAYERYAHVAGWMVYPIEEIKTEDIFYTAPKILFCFKDGDYEKAMDLLNEINFKGFYWERTRPNVIEIIPEDTSKGRSIDMLIDKFGYKKEEIMAFGDENNDVDMLDACVGVIMDNAREELKAKYKYVCDDVRQGGIGAFLKRNGFIE